MPAPQRPDNQGNENNRGPGSAETIADNTPREARNARETRNAEKTPQDARQDPRGRKARQVDISEFLKTNLTKDTRAG